jgi:hypothetical protein
MVSASPPAFRASVTESFTKLPPVKRVGQAMKFPPDHYDDYQTHVLQVAHSVACKELCINEADNESRERVAAMMIAFAKDGHIEVEKLKAFAVQKF